MATEVPFVVSFPWSPGYQLFFLPRAALSTPRNTLIGHFIGLVCLYASYRIAAIPMAKALASGNFDLRPVLVSALSLSATAAIMILLHASHPPADATTLIVSLGITTRPQYLVVIEAGTRQSGPWPA
jgi:CBS domain-containing membrane protein